LAASSATYQADQQYKDDSGNEAANAIYEFGLLQLERYENILDRIHCGLHTHDFPGIAFFMAYGGPKAIKVQFLAIGRTHGFVGRPL
jgi:hypothetical protein